MNDHKLFTYTLLPLIKTYGCGRPRKPVRWVVSRVEAFPCPSPTRRVLGKEPRDCFDNTAGSRAGRFALLKIEKLPVMFGLYFFIFLAFNIYYASFPMHAVRALQWKTEQLGFFFSFAGISMIVVQGPLLSFSTYTIPHDYAACGAALLFALGNGLM